MSSRRKSNLSMPPSPPKKEVSTAKAFIAQATSEQLSSRSSSQVGRPSLEEEVQQKSIKLRQDDLDKLEMLMARWTIKSKSKTRMGLSPIVRSVMAVMLPVLESLDEVPDNEDELRALLQKGFES